MGAPGGRGAHDPAPRKLLALLFARPRSVSLWRLLPRGTIRRRRMASPFASPPCQMRQALERYQKLCSRRGPDVVDSHADFVQVSQQVSRVLVDPVSACPLQFILTIATRKQTH